jgi:hypothetical protein
MQASVEPCTLPLYMHKMLLTLPWSAICEACCIQDPRTLHPCRAKYCSTGYGTPLPLSLLTLHCLPRVGGGVEAHHGTTDAVVGGVRRLIGRHATNHVQLTIQDNAIEAEPAGTSA